MFENEFMGFVSGFSAIFIAPIISEILWKKSFSYFDKKIQDKLVDTARDVQIAILLSLFAPFIVYLTNGDFISIIENLATAFFEFLGVMFGIMARAFYRVLRIAQGPFKLFVIVESGIMMFAIFASVILFVVMFTSVTTVILGIFIGIIAGILGIDIRDIVSNICNFLGIKIS